MEIRDAVGPTPGLDLTRSPTLGGLPSLGRNSTTKLIADLLALASGVVAGVITARFLGPGGKGRFSVLTFVGAIIAQSFSVGLGDAAIITVGQKKTTFQRAFSGTLTLSFFLGLTAMPLIWGTFLLVFRGDWGDVESAAVMATLGLLPALWANTLARFLYGQERFVAGSAVITTAQFVTTLGLAVFVVLSEVGLTTAIVATVLGSLLATTLGGAFLVGGGLRLQPTWDTEYFRAALPSGSSVSASHLLTVGLVRADLIFVYVMAGSVSAGHYSVALSVGLLAIMPPVAMSIGTFPRLANLPVAEADQLIAKVFRFSIVAVFVTSLGLAAATPTIVPLAFGATFRPAVFPTLILLAGAVPWTAQWVLSRAQVARGRTSLHLRVAGLSLIAMCVLDLLAIRRFGILGAAAVSAIVPTFGTAYCLWLYRRAEWWPHSMTLLAPGEADVRVLTANIFRQIRPRA